MMAAVREEVLTSLAYMELTLELSVQLPETW